MRHAILALAAAAMFRLGGAQSTTDTASTASGSSSVTSTASSSGSSYTVDPSTLSTGQKQNWCSLQVQVCRQLCPNLQTAVNTCDATTLDYTCTCPNNLQPNVSDYTNTVPSLQCITYQNQCASSSSDADYIANNCRNFVCGSKGTAALQSSYSASSAMASSTTSGSATGSATGSSTASTASTTETGAAAAVALAQSYGFAGVVCALAAAFGLAL